MPELIDTHTHLEHRRFEQDRDDVIARATSAGVTRLITCGTDLATSQAAMALAREHQGVYATVGVHPHEAKDAPADIIQRLADLATGPKVVAIGEIGLDYHYDFSPRGTQQELLARQLELAVALDMPVVLHNRESDADMRQVVDAAPAGLRGVLHCFLADAAMAEWALDRGLYLGIDGPLTFKNVKHLAGIVRQAPLERLLVETDCPYLAPHPKRGKRNEPAYVAHVAAKLAEVLDMDIAQVARITTENACRLFGLS